MNPSKSFSSVNTFAKELGVSIRYLERLLAREKIKPDGHFVSCSWVADRSIPIYRRSKLARIEALVREDKLTR
jgi:hypothetical protein